MNHRPPHQLRAALRAGGLTAALLLVTGGALYGLLVAVYISISQGEWAIGLAFALGSAGLALAPVVLLGSAWVAARLSGTASKTRVFRLSAGAAAGLIGPYVLLMAVLALMGPPSPTPPPSPPPLVNPGDLPPEPSIPPWVWSIGIGLPLVFSTAVGATLADLQPAGGARVGALLSGHSRGLVVLAMLAALGPTMVGGALFLIEESDRWEPPSQMP